MAAAYRSEERGLDSRPIYHYATGSMNIRYLKPTSNNHPIEIRAKVMEMKGRKIVLECQSFSQNEVTATADVVAIRVFDSSVEKESSFIKHE